MDFTVFPQAPNAEPAVRDHARPVPDEAAAGSPQALLEAVWRSFVDSIRCYA